MASDSIASDLYEEKIDSLLSIIDSSSTSSGYEEPSDLTESTILSKSKEEANQNDRWRLLEVDLKLLKEHYLTIMKEKSVVIEEKNRMAEERSRFVDEKMRFIEEKNHMFEEKRRILDENESKKQNNDLLKRQLEEAMEQNKKLTEERDQLKQEQVDDRKNFESELSEIKEQLNLVKEKDAEIEKAIEENNQLIEQKNRMIEELRDNNELKKVTEERDQLKKHLEVVDFLEKELSDAKEKLDKLVKLNEKDGYPGKKSKQQLEQSAPSDKSQQVPSTNQYPKKVWFWGDEKPLGILFAQLPGGGVCLSSVKSGSLAASAGLRVGDRLLEMEGVNLRNANIDTVMEVYNRCRLYIRMLVDGPETIGFF